MRRLPSNRQQHKTMTRTKQRADKQRGHLLPCMEQLSHDCSKTPAGLAMFMCLVPFTGSDIVSTLPSWAGQEAV